MTAEMSVQITLALVNVLFNFKLFITRVLELVDRISLSFIDKYRERSSRSSGKILVLSICPYYRRGIYFAL